MPKKNCLLPMLDYLKVYKTIFIYICLCAQVSDCIPEFLRMIHILQTVFVIHFV